MITLMDYEAEMLLDLIKENVKFPTNHQKYGENACYCFPCVSARACLTWADAFLGKREKKELKDVQTHSEE